MIDFLDFYCTDNFEFTQMIKYNLTVDDIEASDADVVVANFMMPELKNKPFICTSSLSSLELVENSMPSFMILPVQNTKIRTCSWFLMVKKENFIEECRLSYFVV